MLDEEERGGPVEELEEVVVKEEDPPKMVKIGSTLTSEHKAVLQKVLQDYNDMFAWSHEEMPSIPASLAAYRLNVDPTFKPVKQKMRYFNPNCNATIQEEVDKLLRVGFIRKARYPEWIANVVMVPKNNGKCFPLPKINQLVDSTAGNKTLSFMDAFSGYNQITMHPSDQEKTNFITNQGLYCYKMMPFGLKNAGATYHRLVNKLFKEQIGRTMEVYIDDMITKSQSVE
ncbi:hypothetical protein LWI29_031457 [Acer saccharum]|uniref:Reverse transcriptase domain-containing protein n=1 Tax=Acer saccharum TaxID=4024 RepID=A0AA39RRX5_ACESA|nr:hypothetical protein LWI29_031457 [Acer saccharum]